MSGIPSANKIYPVSFTVAGGSISHTTVATSDTVGYLSKPVAQLWFTNTGNTTVNVVLLPITIDGQGTTVAGTAGYMTSVPAGAGKVYDYKSDGNFLGPCVIKVYADGTPSGGTFIMEAAYNK